MIAKSAANPIFLSARKGVETAAKKLASKHGVPIEIVWMTPTERSCKVPGHHDRGHLLPPGNSQGRGRQGGQRAGPAPVLLAQPTYMWGYESVQRIIDKVHLEQDVPEIIPMDVIRVTKADLGSWARQKTWGFTVPDMYAKMP